MPSNISIHVFRIFQELFNNSIQHSQAKSINVQTKEENGSLIFEYTDDGIGFDENDLNFKEGTGLSTIRERAGHIGAKLKFESVKNRMAKTIITLNTKSLNDGKD